MAELILKPRRGNPLRRQHPWLFSGAVAHVAGDPQAGDTVDVVSADGEWLGRAAFSPQSQIIARIWTWNPDERVDEDFFDRRIRAAHQARARLRRQSNGLRIVNAESDGIPGLVADQYGDYVAAQFLSAGAERWKPAIVEALAACTSAVGVYERSDVAVREKEGLVPRSGVLWGSEPPEWVTIWEQGIAEGRWQFQVDIKSGQKTGFYLDQRESRHAAAEIADGCDVLNAYSYTGAFAVAAYSGGARAVTNVDSSVPALQLARANVALNGFEDQPTAFETGDVPTVLREYRQSGRNFDLIILDPPKFVQHAGQLDRATRAYKDINLQALHLLRPNGYLITFSCSGLVSAALFQKIVFGAALDAGRAVQCVRRLAQSADHPVLLSFPEAEYLKGLICSAL